MSIHSSIYKLRTDAGLSQEQFAEIFPVSQQSVQKWESGESTPDVNKLVKISKRFGISLDALILGNDNRVVEEMHRSAEIKPQYSNIHDWEFYSSNLRTEYTQSVEEGLDIDTYKDVFTAVSRLPKDEIKKKFGDVLFEIVANAGQKEGHPYTEPSCLEAIRALRKPYQWARKPEGDLKDKIHGAWLGRACGCLLGKTVEGIRTDELIPFLKETDNFPMHRYILHADLNEDILSKYKFHFASRCYADTAHGMPADDDTNYTVLYQQIVNIYGRDFSPADVLRAWVKYQPKDAYCTAERVAFCNFIKGYEPPATAIYKNPYREWIGAQIRADYFGYINPGTPEAAAEMAWRDASVSHIKNGIYGEMFVAAMLAVAAQTDHMEDIIRGGLAEIPHTSRLYEAIGFVLDGYASGTSKDACFKNIHKRFDEHTEHGWCHTISNAMIVVASLLYGGGNFGKSICMAVEAGFDTDCNGATVGSVLGMAKGANAIDVYWSEPIQDTIHTSIFGMEAVKISKCVDLTMEHINGK